MRHRSLPRGVLIASSLALLMGGLAVPAAQAQSNQAQQAQDFQAPLTAGQAKALSTNVTDKVIVVLKNQVTNVPDTRADASTRASDITSSQHGVLSDLTATHASNVHTMSLINAVAATVSSGEAKRLAANPNVASVTKDQGMPIADTPVATVQPAAKTAVKHGKLANACTSGSTVQLNPEGDELIHAATQSGKGQSAQALGYTGSGVTVGLIADGLDVNNPDFIRPNGQHVITSYEDFSGTGTSAPGFDAEAFQDASAIGAQGEHTYNVASYTGSSTPCNIRILGVSPGASMVALNVFGDSNIAFNSVFVEAINYAVSVAHVNVLNESFFSNVFPDTDSLDLLRLANDAAVAAGVTVVTATGEAGNTSLIATPATATNVISVGASTSYRTYAQIGGAGTTDPGVTGWLDNQIAGFSAGGYTQAGNTLSVVAPGDIGWAVCTPDPTQYAACVNPAKQASSIRLAEGTDAAAPLTSGVAALVIQAYRQHHGGQTPSPAVVKQIIVSTAQDINAPAEQQGAGLVDAYQAVLAAANYSGTTSATPNSGNPLLDGTTQFNAVGQPGASQSFHETVTNTGSSATTVGVSSRTLSSYTAQLSEPVTFTAANNYSDTITFKVPQNQARLNVAATLQGVISISLIGPGGNLAEYNNPQGDGNYGYAQVSKPAAGTWTAVLSTTAPSGGGSVTAKVAASTATWQQFGSLSTNSLHLGAGATGSFTLNVATPSQPGDTSGSIVLNNSGNVPAFAAQTSIPVTLRSEVSTPNPSTSFTGTLTGGNGRATNTGATYWYEVYVPAGKPALNVTISSGSSANSVQGELIDPSGAAQSTAINSEFSQTSSGVTYTPQNGVQLHALNPAGGLWTIMLNFYNTVSGTAISQPFTVNVNDSAAQATASGLPDASSSTLTAGKAVTVDLKVTNTGNAPEQYFTDGRLSTEATIPLVSSTTATVTLPNPGDIPTYMVPTDTTNINVSLVSQAANTPIFFDVFWPFGDPDIASTTGQTANVNYSANDISAGAWTIGGFLKGPFGAQGAPVITSTASMTATTPAFDSTVKSATGDLWLESIDPSSLVTPVTVNPGQTVTIPVTITPSGTAGSRVSGTLYLDDASIIPGSVSDSTIPLPYPEGSQVAAFNYSYTIAG